MKTSLAVLVARLVGEGTIMATDLRMKNLFIQDMALLCVKETSVIRTNPVVPSGGGGGGGGGGGSIY